MPDGVEAKAASELLKECVIRMGQCFREVHVAAAPYADHRVGSDDAFFESRDGDDRLESRARLEARGERHLLIHDRENPAGGGIYGDDGTVLPAQGIDRGLADNRVIKLGVIAIRGVSISGDTAVAMNAALERARWLWRAGGVDGSPREHQKRADGQYSETENPVTSPGWVVGHWPISCCFLSSLMYAINFREFASMNATSNTRIMEAAYQERNCAEGQFPSRRHAGWN